jgi:hypothetical protein
MLGLRGAVQKFGDFFFQVPNQRLVFLPALNRVISFFLFPVTNGLTAFLVVFAKSFERFALFKKRTDDLFLIPKAFVQGKNALLDDPHGKMPQVVWV